MFTGLVEATGRIRSIEFCGDQARLSVELPFAGELAGGRFGGHFVQGHVDATGKILDLSVHGQDHRLEISLPEEIQSLCIDKGSLAIDGISLTIAELKEDSAVFWIIPHTMQETRLSDAEVGQKVNLEADVIAKHVAKLMEGRTA